MTGNVEQKATRRRNRVQAETYKNNKNLWESLSITSSLNDVFWYGKSLVIIKLEWYNIVIKFIYGVVNHEHW